MAGSGQPTGFGATLKRARLARGLSLRKAGERIGVDFVYLHRLETGARRHPRDPVLRAIAAEYGIRVSDLIVGTDA